MEKTCEQSGDTFQMILNFDENIYKPEQTYEIAKKYENAEMHCKCKSKTKRYYYYDIPVALDLETTSTVVVDHYDSNEEPKYRKLAYAYIWMLQIGEYSIVGRYLHELRYAIYEMHRALKKGIVCVYVHNLGFDFSFFQHLFVFDECFSIKKRQPVRFLATCKVEFRDSSVLAGKTLEKVGQELRLHKVKKMVGDLDYSLVRNPSTPMSFKEMKYCIHDVQVLAAYIAECLETDNIVTIPMTATGYVRRDVRNRCFAQKGYKDYIRNFTISEKEYLLLNEAFRGGFTHANAHHVYETTYSDKHYLENVRSKDETSAYPTMMIAKKFPAGPGRFITLKSQSDFEKINESYLWCGRIRFHNLREKVTFDHILSKSACQNIKETKETKLYVDNGRIVQCAECVVAMTNVNLEMMRCFYEWDYFEFLDNELLVYRACYLPKPIVEAVLDYYGAKTTLKGLDEFKQEYNFKKSLLNAIYGMMVQNIINTIIEYYDGEWSERDGCLYHDIDMYNKSKKRFTHYSWGVWITSYARQAIQLAILETKDDHVYTDTDSEKYLNFEKHEEWFDAYNEYIQYELEECMNHYNIPVERIRPKNSKGVEKPLGVFDDEGIYKKFKTCGAKRYFFVEYDEDEKKDVFNLTVSGLKKDSAVPYICEINDNDDEKIFNFCDDGMKIPAFYMNKQGEKTNPCGKLTRTYLDDESTASMTDYLGTTELIHTYGGCHLEPAEFTMNMDSYKEYLNNYLFDSSI